MKKTNFTLHGLTACLILYTRSAGVVYFAIGAVFCGLSVKVVKEIIRQPRPPPINIIPGRKLKASYGCVEARAFYRSGVITDHEYFITTACRVLTLLRSATTRRPSSLYAYIFLSTQHFHRAYLFAYFPHSSHFLGQ